VGDLGGKLNPHPAMDIHHMSILNAADEDALAQVVLVPQLVAALAAPEALTVLFTPVGSNAVSLPVLRPHMSSALAAELSHFDGQKLNLVEGPDECPCPAVARVSALLARRVLPQLASAARNVLARQAQRPLRGRVAAAAEGPCGLCEVRRSYALRYRAPVETHVAATTGGPDLWRVFRCHVDDSDVTLATCLGGTCDAGPTWRGSDLCYVEARQAEDGSQRPGTPDPSERVEYVHRHAAGVGVLHGSGAYHYVTPLVAGERATLVAQAMWDDGQDWKHIFLAGQDS
jgi:hypothetical protein